MGDTFGEGVDEGVGVGDGVGEGVADGVGEGVGEGVSVCVWEGVDDVPAASVTVTPVVDEELGEREGVDEGTAVICGD